MESKDKKKKYDLYTEHIVPDNTAAKKTLKKALFTCLFGALFGVIAGGVMLLVYAGGSGDGEGNKKPQITLGNQVDNNDGVNNDKDVTVSVPENTKPTTETEPVWDEEFLSQLEELNKNYGVIKAVAGKVSNYTVRVYRPSDGSQVSGFYNTNEAFGLLAAEDDLHYYILTDKTFVNNKECYVCYQDGTSVVAEFVEADETTGFAIVRTLKEGITNGEIAVLGSSDAVIEGDIVVAVGELYGFVDSIGYGMITGSNVTVSDTDSSFKILTTDIVGSANSFGVVANLNGAVTGIITTNYNTGTSNHITAYAIDDVVKIIEKLMNGNKCSYFGIRGQSATEALFTDKNAPKGIYVSTVEINSPAYFAGVQPGDIITAIENSTVTNMDEFMDALYKEEEGSTVEIKAKRKGRDQYKEIVFTVTLGVE